MALEGIQPTFKHVPPGIPRLSIQTVCSVSNNIPLCRRNKAPLSTQALDAPQNGDRDATHLQAQLASLDGSDVSTRSTSQNRQIVRFRLRGQSPRRDHGRSEHTAGHGVGGGRVGEWAEEVGRLEGRVSDGCIFIRTCQVGRRTIGDFVKSILGRSLLSG